MKRFVKITLQDMDNLLKPEKGWVRNVSGYEYVYDYRLVHLNILMKILSSVSTGTGEGRNKGSDAIRVFAVKTDNNGKIIGGYIKQQRVERVTNWRENLRKAYANVLSQVKERKRKEAFL